MLVGRFDYHSTDGSEFKATRRLLREIAVYRSWTVREVIRGLRAGHEIKAGWYWFSWRQDVAGRLGR